MLGEYQHAVDAKGRLFMPAHFRQVLGDNFIVTKGLDNCLFVYSSEEWTRLEEKIRALPLSKGRNLQRFFFAGAANLEADKQGRVLLPSNLRDYASLDREAVIIGVANRVEIWDKQKWLTVCDSITPESVTGLMEELGF